MKALNIESRSASSNLYGAALIAAVWSTGFTVARGCTAGTFAHACTARERPLSFGFTRPRSRGANVQRADKTVSISSSVSAIPRPARRRDGRRKDPRVRHPPSPIHPPSRSHPPFSRDNGIRLLEEELLKRYLKRRLLPNGRVLRCTGC